MKEKRITKIEVDLEEQTIGEEKSTSIDNKNTGEISIEEKMQMLLEDYTDFLSYAFVDIATEYAIKNVDIFFELFYNRKQELNKFRTIAEDLYNTGNNILFIGNAGIGKSNFIYRLFYDTSMLGRYRLYPIMIDFRNSPTSDRLIGVKLKFIAKMTEYFDKMDYSISAQVENKITNIEDNIFTIQETLENLTKNGKKSMHPLIFVDDLDYAEKEELFPILKFLSPYARGKNISILMCVRPPLYHTILHNDGTYAYLFAHKSKHIEACSMELHSILAKRLAPILLLPDTTPKGFFEHLTEPIKRLQSKNEPYQKLLKELGVKKLNDLIAIKYPFTDRYVRFMKEISLGNLREIFVIAVKSLKFILENYKKLKTEGEDERKIIPRKEIISMFPAINSKNKLDNDTDDYHFFNLHEIKNSRGNSLYLNVLEAMQIYQDNRVPEFKDQLNKAGHTDEYIEYALRIMARKRHRLILSYDFTYAKDNAEELLKIDKNSLVVGVQYKISDKGLYYLQDISTWQEYIDVYGQSNESIMINVYGNEDKS
jgi:hypothetical protein